MLYHQESTRPSCTNSTSIRPRHKPVSLAIEAMPPLLCPWSPIRTHAKCMLLQYVYGREMAHALLTNSRAEGKQIKIWPSSGCTVLAHLRHNLGNGMITNNLSTLKVQSLSRIVLFHEIIFSWHVCCGRCDISAEGDEHEHPTDEHGFVHTFNKAMQLGLLLSNSTRVANATVR
jgi:hypothetical protein